MAQTAPSTTTPEFAGADDQQELARRLFDLFRAQGRFFSERSPIRMTVEQLASFMQQQEPGGKDWAARIDAALSANPAVFTREASAQDDAVTFATTRAGLPPAAATVDFRAQTLTRRFATPEPKRETPRVRRKSSDHYQPSDYLIEHAPAPAYDPDSWQAAVAESIRQAEAAGVLQPQAPAAEPATVGDLDEVEPEPVVQTPSEVRAVDVASASSDDLADAVRNALGHELSVARWGERWMTEERVQRFSRGDLRRIEDLLRESNDPVPDTEIVQDVLGVRPNAPGYETARFAVNYRLSHETREFEYLGTDQAGLWAIANQQAIGMPKRKASEIGQDYRFLLDYRSAPEVIEAGLVEHVLSFYEYTNGVLPLDATIATIMPKQGFPEQRAARLTFESPQTHETVVAELRFPTSNRGGFIAGLENFFAANLVPGAVVTVEQTDQPTHFLLEYFQASGTDRKLLHLDERKSRYTFRSTTFYCATQAEMLLTESRFPKLADAKPLDERARRRPEQVVSATFERVGENAGTADAPRYHATFDDLLAATNIERPISGELLRDILGSGTYQEFSADDAQEDAFFYQPGAGS